ncbi:unnamed protein product [Moneuplotes crassus]|uniref:Uncharacterized protein n=1 Tax=Euplotes crassus TaxID=5936 RepID=A0AAD2D471_EUPCR|nr:unnamed protein product [Moneuplotes crassus]
MIKMIIHFTNWFASSSSFLLIPIFYLMLDDCLFGGYNFIFSKLLNSLMGLNIRNLLPLLLEFFSNNRIKVMSFFLNFILYNIFREQNFSLLVSLDNPYMTKSFNCVNISLDAIISLKEFITNDESLLVGHNVLFETFKIFYWILISSS